MTAKLYELYNKTKRINGDDMLNFNILSNTLSDAKDDLKKRLLIEEGLQDEGIPNGTTHIHRLEYIYILWIKDYFGD